MLDALLQLDSRLAKIEKPKTCLGEINAKYEVAALKSVYLQLITDLQDSVSSSMICQDCLGRRRLNECLQRVDCCAPKQIRRDARNQTVKGRFNHLV